jgi:hypothetical protein
MKHMRKQKKRLFETKPHRLPLASNLSLPEPTDAQKEILKSIERHFNRKHA